MNIDEPTEETNSNNNIPDIYIFCDRWCEKCGFTTICKASAVPGNIEIDDAKNKTFWQDIEKHLPKAQKQVMEVATKNALSLTEFEAPKQKKNFDLFQRNAKSNAILKAGRLYEDVVDDWFDNALDNNIVEIVETPFGSAHKLSSQNKIDNSEYINSMFDVVLRYQLQVYLKNFLQQRS